MRRLTNYPELELLSPEELNATLTEASKAIFFSRGLETHLRTLLERCKQVVNGQLDDQDINLPEGTAIAPRKAAKCLIDEDRTNTFVRGLTAAIHEAKRRFPDEKIRVLYAGCGPFASLALLASTQFSPEEVEFHLLDIQENAIDCVKQIIAAFRRERFFPFIKRANAVDYQHQGAPPHIVISETIYTGLIHEPQAAITANLAPQMHPDGIFVPENLQVTFYLKPAWKEGEAALPKGRVAEQLVTEITADIARRLGRRILEVDAELTIPPLKYEYDAFLGTRVRTFRNNSLLAELTMSRGAQKICEIGHSSRKRKLRLRYKLGTDFIDPQTSISLTE